MIMRSLLDARQVRPRRRAAARSAGARRRASPASATRRRRRPRSSRRSPPPPSRASSLRDPLLAGDISLNMSQLYTWSVPKLFDEQLVEAHAQRLPQRLLGPQQADCSTATRSAVFHHWLLGSMRASGIPLNFELQPARSRRSRAAPRPCPARAAAPESVRCSAAWPSIHSSAQRPGPRAQIAHAVPGQKRRTGKELRRDRAALDAELEEQLAIARTRRP
jgi:hypothetical protein